MQVKKKKLSVGRPKKEVTKKMVSLRLYPAEKELLEKHYGTVQKSLDALIFSLLDKMSTDG